MEITYAEYEYYIEHHSIVSLSIDEKLAIDNIIKEAEKKVAKRQKKVKKLLKNTDNNLYNRYIYTFLYSNPLEIQYN